MRTRRTAVVAVTAAALLSGGLVTATTSPATAGCDAISIGKPYKGGDYARARASVCLATNWIALTKLQRYKGLGWWQTKKRGVIYGRGAGVTVQGPLAWKCKGTGTYTYRGQIWATNHRNELPTETSAKNRFKC
jgi:hypothetical protein